MRSSWESRNDHLLCGWTVEWCQTNKNVPSSFELSSLKLLMSKIRKLEEELSRGLMSFLVKEVTRDGEDRGGHFNSTNLFAVYSLCWMCLKEWMHISVWSSQQYTISVWVFTARRKTALTIHCIEAAYSMFCWEVSTQLYCSDTLLSMLLVTCLFVVDALWHNVYKAVNSLSSPLYCIYVQGMMRYV